MLPEALLHRHDSLHHWPSGTDLTSRYSALLRGQVVRLNIPILYAKYIMRNAGLEEAQAAIKIAGRNINNLRYADDTTIMA